MNARGAEIPTAWLLIIPFVNFYWIWRYSQGVEKMTNGASSAGVTFILLFLVGCIGMAVTQSAFNKISGGPAATAQKPADSSAD